MPKAHLSALPLLFSFKQVVAGNGFLAGVRMNGRALLETDQVGDCEEAWISGVAPVGITGGGADRGVAFVEFRNAWIETVFDIAEKAESFDDFRQSCAKFLSSEQESITKLWRDAVAAVRREKYEDRSLHKEKAETSVFFEVVDLTNVTPRPEENQIEKGLQLAA